MQRRCGAEGKCRGRGECRQDVSTEGRSVQRGYATPAAFCSVVHKTDPVPSCKQLTSDEQDQGIKFKSQDSSGSEPGSGAQQGRGGLWLLAAPQGSIRGAHLLTLDPPPGTSKGRFSPRAFRKSMALRTPRFHTGGFHTVRQHTAIFLSLPVGGFVTAALGT